MEEGHARKIFKRSPQGFKYSHGKDSFLIRRKLCYCFIIRVCWALLSVFLLFSLRVKCMSQDPRWTVPVRLSDHQSPLLAQPERPKRPNFTVCQLFPLYFYIFCSKIY